MANDGDMVQKAAAGAIALQGQGDVNVVVGISYADARQIALDVFRAGFRELAGVAREAATERAEQLTNAFLEQLQQANPEGVEQAADPDFQYTLFNAQRDFARSGDQDLGDLLVQLLVDRSKQEQRSLIQIVLNESIATAAKLTDGHCEALALIFILQRTINHGVASLDQLGAYFDGHLKPFLDKLPISAASMQHLEFAGCGTVSVGEASIETALLTNYRGLFDKGFSRDILGDAQVALSDRYPQLFVANLRDSSKLQINAMNENILSTMLKGNNVPPNDAAKIKQLATGNLMQPAEAREAACTLRPYMSDLFDAWDGGLMKHFSLTSVGIAIGHATAKRHVHNMGELSIWIN